MGRLRLALYGHPLSDSALKLKSKKMKAGHHGPVLAVAESFKPSGMEGVTWNTGAGAEIGSHRN